MEKVAIKIRRLKDDEDLLLPSYESQGASGMDLRAFIKESITLGPGNMSLVPTGLAVSIPPGYEAQIRPRSGLAFHHGIGLVNAPGTIDSDYRGEIGIIMINWGAEPFIIRRGDRIAQMVISRVCKADFDVVEDLDKTFRDNGGFGHTGIT